MGRLPVSPLPGIGVGEEGEGKSSVWRLGAVGCDEGASESLRDGEGERIQASVSEQGRKRRESFALLS